jgi:hypothetical protein
VARSTLADIPEASLTPQTIKQMYQLIDQAKVDEQFQKLVYGLVNNAMPGVWKQYKQELGVVFDWFKANNDYRRDPNGVELLHDVWATLDRKRFDCDDAAIWLGAAAEVLGSPAEFVTVSTRPDGEPSHVWVEALINGKWYAMDATVPKSTVGWYPSSGVANKTIWSRSTVGLSGLEGGMMGGFGQSEQDGTEYVVKGQESSAPVADSSHLLDQERSGGGVYNKNLPTTGWNTPREQFTTIPEDQVPFILDPLEDFWGGKHTLRETHNAMMPQETADPNDYLNGGLSGLSEIIKVGGRQITVPQLGELCDTINEELCRQVQAGELHPSQVDNMLGAIFNPDHPWRKKPHAPLGETFWQKNKILAGKITGTLRKSFDANRLVQKRLSSHSPIVEATTMLGQISQPPGRLDPALFNAVVQETGKQLVPALRKHGIHPKSLKFKKKLGHHVRAVSKGVSGLGQVTASSSTQAAQDNAVANIATNVASSLPPGTSPNDPAIPPAVAAGVSTALGVPVGTPAPATIMGLTYTQAGIAAAVLGVGIMWYVSRGTKKAVYRSNGRRRRHRRNPVLPVTWNPSKASSSDWQKYALIAGAAGVGLWIYTKSKAPATAPLTPLQQLQQGASAIGKLLAPGASAAGGAASAAGGGSGSGTPATTGPTSAPGSVSAADASAGFTTQQQYDAQMAQYQASQNPPPAPTPAPAPGPMVTSLDTSDDGS